MVKAGTFQEMETFLKNIHPFNLLPKKSLRELLPSLTTHDFLPKDFLLTPDDSPKTPTDYPENGIVYTPPSPEEF
ncbi:MAG: hypothetical protein KJ630_22715 [Proteobacteria bacterium]|nr:hypothetical protein [Pseudomonadota bacterium]